ncbi:MAG: MFS transporter, partial [Anaerolineales bacterium]
MNRDLSLIAASLMVWGLGEGAFFSFQPLYLQQLGADPIAIGAILGAYGIAQTLAHIPAGYLADRFGRRPV